MQLAVVAPAPAVAIAGYGVLGLGGATIVPIAFTLAGASSDVRPAWAISRITTFGYVVLFAGPPLIGLTARVTGLAVALLIPAALALAVWPLTRVVGASQCQ